jgi:hypothetical protein
MANRFNIAVREIVGNRLTRDRLTGKDQPGWNLGPLEA